ncbi:hypothetical protein [Parerythrobacter aestuarii]|uniref:hypothetical protein n=1 Tax=Parerythrobacter aestuarii TaxID=3020909 RepID=UPI0024DED64E|nr:hypothetical protein [Parerythrobacter aestuarii]
MDGDLILIFGFVLTIIVIVTLGINGIASKSLKHKRWLEEHRTNQSGKASDAKYEALEERVRVLERIATDNNEPLARQIEQLRDLQDTDLRLDSREKTS